MKTEIVNINQLSVKDAKSAGGKGANLGELMKLGINVPPGFVILANCFEKFLRRNKLEDKIEKILQKTNYKNIDSINKSSKEIKKILNKADVPEDVVREIFGKYKKMKISLVAVRSSATVEDSLHASWAGQLETYLDISERKLLDSVKKCWLSLFSPRAISYRAEKNLRKEKISVAVVVQKMIRSEKSGIAFSVHPVTQNKNQLIIEAGIGLGEAIVLGKITPDSYIIQKKPQKIVGKNIQIKQILSDKEILKLSELVMKIEKHFKRPQDIEWAFAKGKSYILQSRPITTLNK